MKKHRILLAMPAVVPALVVIAMVFAGCGNGSTDGGNERDAPKSITITGFPGSAEIEIWVFAELPQGNEQPNPAKPLVLDS